jgi:hypothetical protein
MLADVEVNATVYVQPTSRSLVYRPHSARIHRDRIACINEQCTVAEWRTTERHGASDCGTALVLVQFIFVFIDNRREPSKTHLD